jgi:hypothetical protein
MTFLTPTAVRPLWPYLLLNAAAAVWIAFSGIHRLHNSDSLMFSLASLYAWTPFFWEQDRVGMLVPLVASICPDPVLNLVLQTGVTAFAGLCVPLLLAELVYPHPVGRVAATLANALMLLLAPDRIRENFLYECYYPLAMALGCGALLVLGRGPGWPRWWRVVLAAGLLVLACWVYLGVPLWLGPLALVRGWVQTGEPRPGSRWQVLTRPAFHARTVLGCGLLVAAFWLGLVWMNMARDADPDLITPTPQSGLPPHDWPASWWGFLEHFLRLPGMAAWTFALFGAAAVGVAVAVRMAARGGGRIGYPILAAVPVLLAPAAAEFLFIGTRAWTAVNDHHPRYLLGSLESLQALLALLALVPLAEFAAGRRGWVLAVLAAFALFAAATARYGFPSPDRPRRELDAMAGQWTADLIAADVDAVGGDYWTAWPAVYHVNLVRRQGGDPRVFCGVILRGRVLLREVGYNGRKELRVASRNDGKERAEFFGAAEVCGFSTPVKIGEHGPFEIYLIRPVASGR